MNVALWIICLLIVDIVVDVILIKYVYKWWINRQPKSGWITIWLSDDNTVHTLPIRDLIEHYGNDDCACSPVCMPVPRDDGSVGWQYTHNAMDGRE